MSSLATILGQIKIFEPASLFSTSEPILIYGAGGYGREVAATLRKRGYDVLGFLDRNGAPEIDGLPCRHPERDLTDWQAKKAVVLIGLHNHFVNPILVRDQLLAMGFSRVHVPVEYHSLLERELGARYWLGTQEIYRERFDELKAAFALLADDKSRELFLSTLKYRALRQPDAHPSGDPREAYFPTDLPPWDSVLSWVDGGAFDGDSLHSVPLKRYSIRDVYAFEPDLKNFLRLQMAIRQFREKSPATRIASWPCGLGDENISIKFNVGLGAASAVSEEGTVQCPIMRLDDALQGISINLLKLDIEGAEPQALRGAARIIQEQRPGLAICIYHTPGHLWEIPLMIAEAHAGYRFYIRSHNQNGYDLVLYAIPKKQT